MVVKKNTKKLWFYTTFIYFDDPYITVSVETKK